MPGRIVEIGNEFQRHLEDGVALPIDGMIMKIGADPNKINICGGADQPYAIAKLSTLDRAVNGLTGEKIYRADGRMIPLLRTGWVDLPLISTNEIIIKGDTIKVVTGGVVDKGLSLTSVIDATTLLAFIQESVFHVGIAEEAVQASRADGLYVKTNLSFGGKSP